MEEITLFSLSDCQYYNNFGMKKKKYEMKITFCSLSASRLVLARFVTDTASRSSYLGKKIKSCNLIPENTCYSWKTD